MKCSSDRVCRYKKNKNRKKLCSAKGGFDNFIFVSSLDLHWCIQTTNYCNICLDNNYLTLLEPGTFVAVNLINCNKIPVIGKVTEVKEDEFSIYYWKGSYNKAWTPHMVKSGRKSVPWVDNLPKQSVIMCRFQLDEQNKL